MKKNWHLTLLDNSVNKINLSSTCNVIVSSYDLFGSLKQPFSASAIKTLWELNPSVFKLFYLIFIYEEESS